MSVRSYIIDDREQKKFLLDREVLVSEDVLRTERAQIFGRCWVYFKPWRAYRRMPGAGAARRRRRAW